METMKTRVITQVGILLVLGEVLRWVLGRQGIGNDQLLLVAGATIVVALVVLSASLDKIIKPYETIRQRVAEAARARKPRAVAVDGFAPQRELARQIDSIMRLLEERMQDPNLGPVYLRSGERAGERADTFVDEAEADAAEEPGEVSKPNLAAVEAIEPEAAPAADPLLDSVAPHEPYRELFVGYVQALRAAERGDEVGEFQDFVESLDAMREELVASNPGYDVVFLPGEGAQITPRLVPMQAPL